jgi:hypothetical protein
MISREHYVSESVLEQVSGGCGTKSNRALTRGLAFQKPGEQKQLGIARLTAKILCDNHNSLLSGNDTAANLAFGAIDRMNEGAGKPGWPQETLHIDGDAFERWMLKTLCGGLYSGAFLVRSREIESGTLPSMRALRVLFEGAEFPENCGLYYLHRPVVTGDDKVLTTDTIHEHGGDGIHGIPVGFFGFLFALTLKPMLPADEPFDDPVFRPAGLAVVGSNTQIVFDWKDGAVGEKLVFRLGA